MSLRRPSPSSPSTSSSDEERPFNSHDTSKEPKETQQKQSNQREKSVANSDSRTVHSGTNTIRSGSPTISHRSVQSTHRSQDAVSVQSKDDRNVSHVNPAVPTTTTSAQQSARDFLPRAVVGPQPPRQVVSENTTSSVNQLFNIDGKSVQQQRSVRPDVSPYSGSTSSYTDGSISSSTTATFPQQRASINTTTVPNQTYIHPNSAINQQEHLNAYPTNGQYYHFTPQSQFSNQLYDAYDSKDVALNIDYGAIEAHNIGMQAPTNFTDGQLSGGVATGGAKFDLAKALFNQADVNHDGVISQEEFQQWAQRGTQNYGTQSYSNYHSSPMIENHGHHSSGPQILDSTDAGAASIIQQSGLRGFLN